MTHLATTPLENWVRTRMGLPVDTSLTADGLIRFQLDLLNRTIAQAAVNSPFYLKKLGGYPAQPLTRIEQIGDLPFTSVADVQQDPLAFLAVSQDEVARVVTLQTSGTTGVPKRIFFNDADLESIVDFFSHGMATLVAPGQRVLILLPGALPDTVGDLLHRALARLDVAGIVYGVVQDPGHALQAIMAQRIDCIVGIPVQVLTLARHPEAAAIPAGQVKSVLLSTDYVPAAIVHAIQGAWGCQVFQHYGMTEMGYGAAVSCAAHNGYHLREAELFFEIIDPQTLKPVEKGRTGEVVFTTLGRRAMPLIRYRTGDLAAWIETPCPCGAALRRMSWVQGRHARIVNLDGGIPLDLTGLDEALFALAHVVNYQAVLGRDGRGDHLRIVLYTAGPDDGVAVKANKVLGHLPAIRKALDEAVLRLAPVAVVADHGLSGSVAKRKILDHRAVKKCDTHE